MRGVVMSCALLALAGAFACSDPTAPLEQGVAQYNGPLTPDTTPATPAKVRVTGHVLGATAHAPTGTGDSISFEPVPHARLRIMRNVIVDGTATQVLAIELLTGDHGEYTVTGLPGGYYIVYAYPPTGSVYADNWSYLAAMQTEVTTDVYVWKKN